MPIRSTRPDFSDYVVHFTKDAAPLGSSRHPDQETTTIAGLTAPERLFQILSQGCIRATYMPWTNKLAVCFTECTWASLLDHANNYSRFGVGFNKSLLFAQGGGPAIYLPPALLEEQKLHIGEDRQPFADGVFAFVTPFCPAYAPRSYRDSYWRRQSAVDYSHEREWRVPGDLEFRAADVAFVIVAAYEDMARAPRELKDAIGRDKWLLMDNYERIEQLWPVHQMPTSARRGTRPATD